MLKLLNDLSKNISVVCNDAGAANIILHWVKLYNFQNLNFCVDGPAIEIFTKHFPSFVNNRLNVIIKKNNLLLSGTSWNSQLEHSARKLASQNNVYSIAVIDHWVNYKQRFQFNNEYILPNEIWVTDLLSYRIAKNTFFDLKIRMLPNLYEKYQIQQVHFKRNKLKKSKNVLYILEPIRVVWDEKINIKGEFQALDFFIENLKILNLSRSSKIILRLHPSEKKNKYDNWIKMKKGYNIKTSDLNTSLYDDIAQADWVVGCNSYALVIALKAKVKVASALPPQAPDCVLPFPNILKMKDKII